MSDGSDRYVIETRLLGTDDVSNNKKRRKNAMEFAIDVTLSDESSFVVFRTVKEIADLHSTIVSQFPVEAGYFDKKEAVIPTCPVKKTIFGPSRIVREDRVFEKLLNSYIKELPGMPASIAKSDLINKFFALRPSDMSEPGTKKENPSKKKRRRERIQVTEDSSITGPMRLRSYYAVASYSDAKTKFSFAEGAVVQVLQKDASGWWMVDASGAIGWAPASYLVPVDDGDLADEAKENERLMKSMRVGARYISCSAYQASRDDEISFVKGAVVKLIRKYADGWWLVRYNGGEGFVPGSMFRKFDRRQGTAYVKNIRRKFHTRKSTRIIPTMKPKWMTNPTTVNKDSTSSLVLYQCLTRYKASDSSEISLNKDDMVKVLDKKDHGWWYVEDRHGRAGWAPATYLGPVVDKAKKDTNPRNNSIVGSTREVRTAYTAEQKDELSVVRGDKVTVLSAPDDGWWVVCNMVSMEQGLIPSVCLNEMVSEPAEGDKEDKEKSSEILESIKELSKALEEQELAADDGGIEEEDDDNEHIHSDSYGSDQDDILDGCMYVSTTDYSKQAQDELSVKEGQLVTVVDNSDRSMFYVIVDGKEGWIPSDILKMTSESGMWSMSSSVSSLASRGRSHSRSVSPSPMNSRSPSPMDLSEFDPSARTRQRSLPHPSSNPTSPNISLLRPEPVCRRKRTKSLDHSDKQGTATSSEVQIHVETHSVALSEDASLEDIEKAAMEAEMMAEEAQRKATELREKAKQVKRASYASSKDSDS